MSAPSTVDPLDLDGLGGGGGRQESSGGNSHDQQQKVFIVHSFECKVLIKRGLKVCLQCDCSKRRLRKNDGRSRSRWRIRSLHKSSTRKPEPDVQTLIQHSLFLLSKIVTNLIILLHSSEYSNVGEAREGKSGWRAPHEHGQDGSVGCKDHWKGPYRTPRTSQPILSKNYHCQGTMSHPHTTRDSSSQI